MEKEIEKKEQEDDGEVIYDFKKLWKPPILKSKSRRPG